MFPCVLKREILDFVMDTLLIESSIQHEKTSNLKWLLFFCKKSSFADFDSELKNRVLIYFIKMEKEETSFKKIYSILKLKTDHFVQDALMTSCEYGNLNAAKCLINSFSLKIEDIRSMNNFCLRWSCRNGHLKLLKYLCKTFALQLTDLKCVNYQALVWAVANDHSDIVKYLTKHFNLRLKVFKNSVVIFHTEEAKIKYDPEDEEFFFEFFKLERFHIENHEMKMIPIRYWYETDSSGNLKLNKF